MLARDQQQVAEALSLEGARLLDDFFTRESDPQDRIVARKATVLAIVNTLVRQIQRSEEANHFAEPLPRDLARVAAKRFECFASRGRNEIRKIL